VHKIDSDVKELSKESKDLTSQLKALNENVDLLTKVTAISVGKETIFKGMEELGDKVHALDVYDLPDKIVAMLVGSTPNSVQNARSLRKRRTKTKLVQVEASQPQEEEKK
jgi:DNA integrity scanning protein DisA with diadenylate cyclase activity